MGNISCRWKVELDGVNLYSDDGTLLDNFIPSEFSAGDLELLTDEYCEWNGSDIAYRWDQGTRIVSYK